MSPIPMASLTRARTDTAVVEPLQGADGQPLVYPVPLFVRNTFIDHENARPPSLEDFMEERRVRSCPTSLVVPVTEEEQQQEAGAPSEAAQGGAGGVMGWWRSLLRSKTYSSGAGTPDTCQPPYGGVSDQDIRSECSTVDTADAAFAQQVSFGDRQADFVPGQLAFGDCAPVSGWPVGPVTVIRLEDSVAAPSAPSAPSAPECGDFQSGVAAHFGSVGSDLAAAPVAGPGAPEPPSIGSAGHHMGQCKPCAFFNSKGCKSGKSCPFCHMCDPGEKKRRQKEKRTFFSSMRKLQNLASGEGWRQDSSQ